MDRPVGRGDLPNARRGKTDEALARQASDRRGVCSIRRIPIGD